MTSPLTIVNVPAGRLATAPERVELWSCTGCGARGMADLCTGDCDERPVDFVRGTHHDAFVFAAAEAERAVAALADEVRSIADEAPEGIDWPRMWRAWKHRARAALHDPVAAWTAPPDPQAVERVATWWCASCGRVEAPQPCLGICTRWYDDWVRADQHEATVARAVDFDRQATALRALLSQLAHLTPREGQEERTAHALQARARALLGE